MSEKFLYGLPGAEELYFDPETVWEADIEPAIEDWSMKTKSATWTIEKWTTADILSLFPKGR